MSSPSNPCRNPSANCCPILRPSSAAPGPSIPSRVLIPAEIPVPILVPASLAIPASFAFPLPLHHSANGSAIKSSHRILAFPNRSAFCQSSVRVMPLNFVFIFSTLLSTRSMKLSSADSMAGTMPVSQSAAPRIYGDSLSPNAFFAPSTALPSRVREPCRLSSMVSDIFLAAPSAWLIASDSLS